MDAETQQKTEVFVKAVVRNILESSGKVEVFKGNLASIAWAMTSFGPKWMIVS
jgi:1-acylglycerone phosphate reductase